MRGGGWAGASKVDPLGPRTPLLLHAHISCVTAIFPEPPSFGYLVSLDGGFALPLRLSSWVCMCAEGSIPGPLLVKLRVSILPLSSVPALVFVFETELHHIGWGSDPTASCPGLLFPDGMVSLAGSL